MPSEALTTQRQSDKTATNIERRRSYATVGPQTRLTIVNTLTNAVIRSLNQLYYLHGG